MTGSEPAPGLVTPPAADNHTSPAPDTVTRDPLLYLCMAASLLLYLVSMPKTVALEDDSIFILSGYFDGVSHPPGYPLYTLIVHLFTQLPFGEVASRAHASSAVFAALSCGLMFGILRLLGLARPLAGLTVLAFAVSSTFWSQAIITEVYTLNLCLNLGLLLYALRIAGLGGSSVPGMRDFLVFSTLLGLALANHWPLTVLAMPGYLLLVTVPGLRLPPLRILLAILPAVVVTLIFYLYLYFNNQSQPPISFSGPFDDWRHFVDFILRSHYAGVDQSGSAGWADKLGFIGDLLMQFVREANLLLIFAGIGLYRMLQSSRWRLPALALAWIVFSNSFLLALMIGFDHTELYTVVFRVYTLVSVAALFLLGGAGIRVALDTAGERLPLRGVSALLVVCLAINLALSLPQNFRHHYTWGEEYVASVLAGIPQGAVVFTDGDVQLGLLAYAKLIHGHRPDLELYASSALLLENRLFDYRLDDKKAFLENYMASRPQQAFYIVNNLWDLEFDSATIFAARAGRPDGKPSWSINSEQVDLLVTWSQPPYSHDPWTRFAVADLRREAVSIMVPLLREPGDENHGRYFTTAIDSLLLTDDDTISFLANYIGGETQIEQGYFDQQLAAIDRSGLGSKKMQAHYDFVRALAAEAEVTEERLHAARQSGCIAWFSTLNRYCQAIEAKPAAAN